MAFRVKALYEYTSNHEDDLPFSVGQIITITEQDDADWYGGEYIDDAGVKQEGIFPRNFVEKFEPTAPPRPQRTRTKKEADPATESAVTSPVSPEQRSPTSAPTLEPEPEPQVEEDEEERAAPAPAPVVTPVVPPSAPVQAPVSPPTASEVPVPKPAEAASATSPPIQAAKIAPSQAKPKPAGPPPVSEKPTSSSFKDRIAAFNKPAAPPIAPFKPSGLGSGSSGFIKKPFVAPPPSKNAYVPPPRDIPVAKLYRRDEDPEIKEREAENLESAERAGLIPARSNESAEGADDEPKPLSLKERLALLQKQQAEQASRHADAAAKKEKPKRPPKKRTDTDITEGGEATTPAPLQRRDTEDTTGRASLDEAHPPRISHPKRRTSSKEVEARDGNEADLSGAGDTTEGQEDFPEREDSDERSKRVSTIAKQDHEDHEEEEEEEADEEDDDEDVDPEVKRKEELRARMARLGGGMGMPGLFGAPMMPMPGSAQPPKKKKPAAERRSEDAGELVSSAASAPPVPTPMALPGMSRVRSQEEPPAAEPDPEVDEEESTPLRTPHQESAPTLPSREPGGAPPIPSGRPAPPPVPADSRPPPPLPPSATDIRSPSEGSESDDELSERTTQDMETTKSVNASSAGRAPPPPPVAVPPPMPPTSPRSATSKRRSVVEELSPASPARPSLSKRDSRPPPIPGSAPAIPSTQARPPPPPPPGAAPPLARTTTGSSRPGAHEDEDEEITEYEGDYDTDIASSVPHKDALKAHQRESSFEDTNTPVRSPVADAPPSFPPPIPSGASRVPPPIPSQPPPPPASDSRKSVDFPRTAPPPPPPLKETPSYDDDDYDPYNYTASPKGVPVMPGYTQPPPPPPQARPTEEAYSPETPSYSAPQNLRAPPPAPPTNRGPGRQSLDVQRPGQVRRSVDASRPSIESGFVANDIDLARQSGWWLQPNSLPPQLQGRKDIFFESDESTAADPHQAGKMIVSRDVYILYQDYSQTVITVQFDPRDTSDVHLEQRHEGPPRNPRQDQLEQSYERFGRSIGEAAQSKKDSVVGDGTPQGLVYELLRPFKDALLPVGTRAYGALIYGNMANASITQNDEIRPGDIISIRNAKFQGKHGAMHAKYSVEVGKPDHVGVVAEWDGTKKKVRAWEQGRESKKVKMESFKLDDLRSGEVKIWRVMPRSWIGWEGSN